MSTQRKRLVGAALAGCLLSSSAFAAIDDDNIPPLGSNTFGTTGGMGELFLSIVARDPGNETNNQSYVRDLGLTADQFIGALNGSTLGSLGIADFGPDADLQSFLTDNAGLDISFNVTGVHNGPDFDPVTFASADVGFLTSASPSTTADAINGSQPQGSVGFTAPATNLSNFINNVNLASGSSDIAENVSTRFNFGEPGFHDESFGSNVLFGFDTEGLLGGAPVGFYFIGLDNSDNNVSRFPDLLGFWSLAQNGTLGFQAVPVPAAVWLLGSALLGLFGVARRRAVA